MGGKTWSEASSRGSALAKEWEARAAAVVGISSGRPREGIADTMRDEV